MGLFSSKYVVSVSSVPYNMAGDLVDRINFLKSTVSYHVLRGSTQTSFGDALRKGYLEGPGMDQKSFFRWAKTHYTYGMPTASLVTKESVPFDLVKPVIEVPEGMEASVISAFIDSPNTFYWAQRHVLDTRPEEFETAWTESYEAFTETLTIGYEDGSFDLVPLVLSEGEPNYLVVYYYLVPVGTVLVPEDAPSKVFIYKIGSGEADLDALQISYPTGQEFFPVVPVRINNVPISHESFSDDYENIARAYKKATGQKLTKLLEKIDDNPNIADIDYAFMVFGVELNTQENEGRRYIYEFLRLLSEEESNTVEAELWLNDMTRRPPGENSLLIQAPEIPQYKVELSWITIRERRFSGLGKPDAKKGDVWFENLPDVTGTEERMSNIAGRRFLTTVGWQVPQCKLFFQDQDGSHRVLEIFGLQHRNYVYSSLGERVVLVTSSAALTDTDESGFIIPLHYPTLKKMPMVDGTQLALSNRILVFNTYTVTKIRWYQRGIFKLVLALVVGIVGGLFFPGAIGLLGANAALGASLGFTGITAAIVGGAVNALAALVLTTFIEAGATAIFGEKLGGLIGSLVSFFTMSYVMNFQLTGNLGMNWGDLFKAENLMKLMDAVSGGVAGWARGELTDINNEMISAESSFEKNQAALEKRAQELLGYGGGFLDPLMFTKIADLSAGGYSYAESSDTFLSRTLMTGSDIVELSLSMIEEFPRISLELPKSLA